MYAKKHRPMQKLTAICLSVSIAAASLLSGHVFAFDESAQPDGELLYGQRLLDELREMGLGQPDEDIVTDPVPEIPAPGTDAETGGESASDPNAGTGESDPGVSDPDAGTGDNTGSSDAETGGDTEQPGEGGGSTETPVQPSDPAQPGGDGDGGTTEPSDPALPDEGGDNTGSEDPAESTDPTEDPSGETDSEPSDETDSDGDVTEPPVDSEQPAESETPAASTDDAQEENQPVVIGRVPLLIDNDEATVEEPTTVEDEDKTPAEPSGSDDGETPPTGNTSDEETTSGEDGSTNPPESQNPSEPSSEPSTPATPGEGENEGSNSSEPQEPSVPSTPSTPGEGETTPPTGEDGGNTGEQPIGPSHPIETPSESTGSEDIPEEDPPAAGYDRVALEAYVQELDAEQIVSLDDTNITEAEYDDLYSMLTYQQLQAIELYLNPPKIPQNVTTPEGLVETPETVRPLRAMSRAPRVSDGSVPRVDNPGLFTSKTADMNEDGTSAEISLEAYVSGDVISSAESVPLDIVLVLDQSGSMAEPFEYNYETFYEQYDGSYLMAYNQPVFHQAEDGNYHQLEVTREWSWGNIGLDAGYIYTFTCETCNEVVHTHKCWLVGLLTPVESSEIFAQRYTSTTISRINALKNSVEGFLSSVRADAEANNVKHRVAIVGFGSESGNGYNTEILSIEGENSSWGNNREDSVGVAYGSLTPTDYQDALRRYDEDILDHAIEALATNGATRSDLGMEMAKEILDANAVDGTGRKQVVIMFTDGTPTSYSEFDSGVANDAVTHAKSMKGEGVSVYTIGIFAGAQPLNEQKTENNLSDQENQYMHAVSSNYPDATSYTYRGSPANTPPKSYYLSAKNADALDVIFQNIYDEIVKPSLELGRDAVLKDVVSDYFQLPEGFSADRVTVEVWEAYGNENAPQWRETNEQLSATFDPGTKTVSVTSFDYSANAVVQKDGAWQGKKIVVQFDVEPRTGFLGGNGVPTNGDDSGVYDGSDKVVEHFDRPKVDVPIKQPTVDALDKNVYLLGSLPEVQRKEGATVTVKDVYGNQLENFNLNDSDFGLTWQDDFVDITVTTTSPAKPANENGLTEDDEFTLAVSISPKNASGAAEAQTASDTADVYVFKPEITWKDSAINAGETPNYDDSTQDNCNFVSVQWKHGDTVADSVIMVNTKPELEYTFTPPEGALTEETLVNVTVSIGEQNVDEYVTHHHEDNCTFEGCRWDEVKNKCEFIVHIKSFDLTVVKEVDGTYNPEDTFRFTVTGPDGFETSFTLEAGEEIVLKDLPSGTYTVEEDQSWSWRYECDEPTQTVGTDGGIQIVNGTATVTFENYDRENQWLSWEDTKVNIFQPTGTNG